MCSTCPVHNILLHLIILLIFREDCKRHTFGGRAHVISVVFRLSNVLLVFLFETVRKFLHSRLHPERFSLHISKGTW
jgi:hypothetical protein